MIGGGPFTVEYFCPGQGMKWNPPKAGTPPVGEFHKAVELAEVLCSQAGAARVLNAAGGVVFVQIGSTCYDYPAHHVRACIL